MIVPIACRFVPYDQWLLTHLDDASKVKHAKHWILSKCNFLHSLHPHSQRPVSPITFAPTIRTCPSIDSLDDGYCEDDEFSDQDLLTRNPPPSPLPLQPKSSPLINQYTLLSFSTGAILEDEFALSWYNLRPYELLEMHAAGTIAPLPRDILTHYIQPYFQAKARVMRAVWNHKSARFEAPGTDAYRDKAKDKSPFPSPVSSGLQSEKRRKSKLDWKARWVVINQGVLSLCKDRVTSSPLHQFHLSNMRALRGADALEHAFSLPAQPRAVCVKFGPRFVSSMDVVSPPLSSPSSVMSEDLKTNVRELLRADSVPESNQTAKRGDSRERYTEYIHDPTDTEMGEGEWVVLDMLDDNAFSSILRVLHRQASYPISSSFVPSSSVITVSSRSPALTSFVSHDTVPYPEWRINTVENARKAGIGDVGKPMAWVLWTEKGLGDSLLGNIRHHRQAFSREMQYKSNPIPDIYRGPDDESDSDSEMEWDGWMRDLERQCRVKQRSESVSRSVVSRQVHIPSSTSSSLPSPPLSEASPSGSPRGRSPSLSVSHLTSSSFGSQQYPNIGDVIQASGTHGAEMPIRSTTVSTVSVGASPPSRRRSSTLSAEVAKTTKHSHDKELFPSVPAKGARTIVRTAAGRQGSRGSFVRHVHSSSNLRISSSPIYESDAADSSAHPGPSSPSKPRNAFMRTMSVRAGKIVRGLESAIDFVDDKT